VARSGSPKNSAPWERQPDGSIAVARSIYLRLPSDARLWQKGRLFVPVERGRLEEAFARP
jgi:hypothetical protein